MSSDYVMLIFRSQDFRTYLDELKTEIDFGPDVLLNAEAFRTGEPYGVFSNVEACFYYVTNWYRLSPIGRIIREIKKIVKYMKYKPTFTDEEVNAYDRYQKFILQHVFHIKTHINFKIENNHKPSYIIKIKDLLEFDESGRIGGYGLLPVKQEIDMEKMIFIIEHTGSSFELFETAADVLISDRDWYGATNNVYVSYLNRGCGIGSQPGRPNYIDGTCSTITKDVLEKIASREGHVMTKDRALIASALGAFMNQPDDVGGIVEQFITPAAYARFSAALRRRNSPGYKKIK